jgi:hypothetical protein
MMRFVSAFAAMMMVAGACPRAAWALGDAPVQTSAFIDYCKTYQAGCIDEVGMVSFGLLTNVADRSWCPTKEVADVDTLTPKVAQWMTAHPETYGRPTVEGIEAALKGLFPAPCKH